MRLLGVTLALLVLSAPVATISGQESGQEAQEQEVDSLRLRLIEKLQRLAREPGADSALFVADSIRREMEASGNPGTSADSVAQMLLSMPGFSLTSYQAERAAFDATGRVFTLNTGEGGGGRVRLIRGDVSVEADTAIRYDEGQSLVRARGNPVVATAQGEPLEADALVYHVGNEYGSARGASTQYREAGTTWTVQGDMPHANADSLFLTGAHFTSCDLEHPHYHFAMNDMKIVNESVLVGRGVRLYFDDVPVFWLPFVAQSLAEGRQSGILTPRFSVNDIVRGSSGYKRRISNLGFYWAISDYADALTAFDWFSDNFVSLTGAAQYRVRKSFLEGNLTMRRYWGADGGTKLSFETGHSWAIDERSQVRVSGAYASDTDFVRANSFNPQEVTQSIDSEGGASRRFDWGALSVSSNRRQYLSDDRTEWTLPSANLSLSTITLFPAPANRAGVFNNLTWSGSASYSRSTVRRIQPDTFDARNVNMNRVSAGARHSLSLGRLSIRQDVSLSEQTVLGIPEAFIMLGDSAPPSGLLTGAPARSVSKADVKWSTGIDYQQQLVGSTTITPKLSISGTLVRSDTSSLARDFVTAPMRVSFGANLKTDIYGFGPGFGDFETIRHKWSPSIEYRWSPGAVPTQLQQQVFGPRALQPQNVVSLTLNQTWEAKRAEPEEEEMVATGMQDADPGLEGEAAQLGDSLTALDPQGVGQPGEAPGVGEPSGLDAVTPTDPVPVADPAGQQEVPLGQEPLGSTTDDGPRRVQQNPPVNLLALRTSVISYDFVVADSLSSVLQGFQTTRLQNQISSDYLRGLVVSIGHDLFDDTNEGGRRLAPHLSEMNFGFGLGSESGLFRWLGRLLKGGGEDGGEGGPGEPQVAGPFENRGATDESSVIPGSMAGSYGQGGTGYGGGFASGERRGSQGGWTLGLNYSLQRPRGGINTGSFGGGGTSQVISADFAMRPTEMWDLTWTTSYDMARNAFNDHQIRLTRDLHRWRANFDFLKTATGNWSFRFEVALIDNQDFKFDYEQRDPDAGIGGYRGATYR